MFHVNIIMLHADIIYPARREQRYATISYFKTKLNKYQRRIYIKVSIQCFQRSPRWFQLYHTKLPSFTVVCIYVKAQTAYH